MVVPDRSPAGVAGRPQFSLRDLFAATTGVAAACGLAAWQGVGTLAYSLGLLLSLFNATGRLSYFQSTTMRPKCFYLAWGLLFTSLFVPAVPGCNDDLAGWQVAAMVATSGVQEAGKLFDPENEQPLQQTAFSLVAFGLLNLANTLALLSPLLLYWLQRGRGKWLGIALAVCSVVAWSVGWGEGLLIGFYLWSAGFAILLTAYRINWGTFAVMVAVLPVGTLISWLIN